MVLCTVQHICGVDELIARAPHPQLSLRVPQHYLPPAQKTTRITSACCLQFIPHVMNVCKESKNKTKNYSIIF